MKHLHLMILTLLLCALCVCGAAETTMTVMNIGKADCILLQTEHARWLVDTGTEETWGTVQTWLEKHGVSSLDGVILTHADKDHIGGVDGLLASGIRVNSWYTSAFCSKYTWAANPAVNAVEDAGQEMRYLRQGDMLQLSGNETLRVLWPKQYAEDENENSLVLLLETADGRILLMGDALTDDEKDMVADGLIPVCDILKVGHHGREDATGKKLLSACCPKIAVITTEFGDKKSKADPDVLKRLLKKDIQVILTHNAPAAVKLTLDAGRIMVNMMGD